METWVSEVTTDSWLSQARLVLWVGYDWRLSVRSLLPSSWLCWRLTDRFRSRFMLNSLSDSAVESSSSSSISKAIKSKPDFESSWYVPWPIHSPWSKQRITNQLGIVHLQNKYIIFHLGASQLFPIQYQAGPLSLAKKWNFSNQPVHNNWNLQVDYHKKPPLHTLLYNVSFSSQCHPKTYLNWPLLENCHYRHDIRSGVSWRQPAHLLEC